MSRPSVFLRQVPNILSVVRIALTPIIVYLLVDDGLVADPVLRILFAIFLYVLTSLTDFYDGYLARKHQLTSTFGALVDPLADKIFILAIFYAFMAIEHIYIPWVLVLIIVVREVFVTVLKVIAVLRKQVMETEFHGKFKTTFQMGTQYSILIILFVYALLSKQGVFLEYAQQADLGLEGGHPNLFIDFNRHANLLPLVVPFVMKWFPTFSTAVTAIVTAYSGYKYFMVNRHVLKPSKK